LLSYYFFRLAFLDSWRNIVSENDRDKVFSSIEKRLNEIAKKDGEISLTVPFACLDCRK
jgi:arsenite methyltransferase